MMEAEQIAKLEEALVEMTRRRDEWRRKAEGFDTIRHALREKVGSPWPPHLSRALWAALAADEKKRADDLESQLAARDAEIVRLKVMIGRIIEAAEDDPDYALPEAINEVQAEMVLDALHANGFTAIERKPHDH